MKILRRIPTKMCHFLFKTKNLNSRQKNKNRLIEYYYIIIAFCFLIRRRRGNKNRKTKKTVKDILIIVNHNSIVNKKQRSSIYMEPKEITFRRCLVFWEQLQIPKWMKSLLLRLIELIAGFELGKQSKNFKYEQSPLHEGSKHKSEA